MNKIIVGFLLLLLNTAAGCTEVALTDSLEVRINTIFEAYGSHTPGAVIGIIDHGRLVYKKGYGMANLERGFPNTPDKIYKIASVSKQFTAAVISLLIQQKYISLEDDIRQYIPDFPDYGKPVTISNLLYHTSGIRDYMVLMWLTGRSFEESFDNRDAMEIIRGQKQLDFITGHRCVYSNSNYILLAEIVKKVMGTPFEEYSKQYLFYPLGMNSSGYNDSKFFTDKSMAISYKRAGSNYLPYKNENRAIGDGGMYTTLEDLVKWDRAFYDTASINQLLLVKGKLENGNQLSYGRGIMTGMYRGQAIHRHPGAFLGYRSEILRFPEKQVTIVLLGNSEDINPEEITGKVADFYIFNENVKEEFNRKMMPLDSTKYDLKLAGIYEVGPSVFIEIKQQNNELTGKVSGQPTQKLYRESKYLFKVGSTDDHVVFDTDSSDTILQLTVLQGKNTVKAKKLEFVSGETLKQFSGIYYNAEQKANYIISVEEGALWFKVGTNPKLRAEVVKKYDTFYFSYLNLENASIKFNRDSLGVITGFTLGSGRIKALKFDRK